MYYENFTKKPNFTLGSYKETICKILYFPILIFSQYSFFLTSEKIFWDL